MLARVGRRLSLALKVLLTGREASAEPPNIPELTTEEVAEARRFFPLDKFFIFGHARSGTTLLARLVRVHPEVHCNWQAHFFTRPPLLAGMAADPQVRAWLARRSNRWNRGRDLTPVALRAMADFILERDARRHGARLVGDKSPNVLTDGQAVRNLRALYPDARLVYLVRDGRDTLISHRFQNFIDAPHTLTAADLRLRDEFARDPAPFFEGKRSLFTQEAIRRMAEGWARNVTETHRLGQELYGQRYLWLRFEELLKNPYQEIARLWVFLEVDPSGLEEAVAAEMESNPDAEWQQHKAGDLVASLEKGKRGSWRQLFTDRDRRVFKELAGEALIAWGYEQDLDW